MSNKFGLVDDPEEQSASSSGGLDLSSFAPVKKRAPIDLMEVDAAAAPHGFVSREAAPQSIADVSGPSVATRPAVVNVRRRLARPEPSRSLAVRMVVPEYDRFVAYADRHQLTYHEAIKKLLDGAGE
jgi:hypothetical protein